MIYLVILLLLLLCGAGYIIWNLLVKVETLEDFIIQREDEVQKAISDMQEIDASGAFEAEDEVGAVFTQLKTVVDTLNQTYDE